MPSHNDKEELDYLLRQFYLAQEIKLKREIEPWNPVYGNQTDSIKVATDFLNKRYEEILSFLSFHQATRDEELVKEIEMYFAHIGNDGVTGKPMNIPQEEIASDVLALIKTK